MPGFKTHITTSTTLGVVYGVGGPLLLDAPVSASMLAGGLCSVSGMLPDLDSDSGVPVREMTAFAAAVVPMLLIDRFRHFGWDQEMMVFVGGVIYAVIRFGVVEVFKKYTAHRGMWHSIPAAGIVGLVAYLVCSTENSTMRGYLTGAVVLGFMSHLVLDEIWSFEVRQGKVRIKRSFGTALKFWGSNRWGNISVYAKLIVLSFLVVGDPMMMDRFGDYRGKMLRMAQQSMESSRIPGVLGEAMSAAVGSAEEKSADAALPPAASLFPKWNALSPRSGEPPARNARSEESAVGSEETAPDGSSNQLVPSPIWTLRR